VIRDHAGKAIGRAALTPLGYLADTSPRDTWLPQVTTSGGFRAGQIAPREIVGVLLGEVDRASRYWAEPFVRRDASLLSDWCSEQLELLPTVMGDSVSYAHFASFARSVGGRTGKLPIAMFQGKLVSFDEIVVMQDLPDIVYLVDYSRALKSRSTLEDDEFGVITGSMKPHTDFQLERDPQHRATGEVWAKFWMSLWGAAVEAIANSWNVSLQNVIDNSDIRGCHEIHGSSDDARSLRIVMRRDTIRRPR
jgi:hypothetical protein